MSSCPQGSELLTTETAMVTLEVPSQGYPYMWCHRLIGLHPFALEGIILDQTEPDQEAKAGTVWRVQDPGLDPPTALLLQPSWQLHPPVVQGFGAMWLLDPAMI